MYYAIPGRARAWRKFYRQVLRPGDLCFDIGAHVGNRTRALLALGARVVAVEPQPLFARVLLRLYQKSPNFTLVQAAVGNKNGESTMLISSRAPTVSTLAADWTGDVGKQKSFSNIRWDQREVVQVTTLDELIFKHGLPVLCKLDIEGYELHALEVLSHEINLISFEYIPAVLERGLGCIDRLAELGHYEFNLVEGEIPKFVFVEWTDTVRIKKYLGTKLADERPGEVYAKLSRKDR